MSKEKFLIELEDKLNGLPIDEIKESVNFYSEMIDDHMDEGLSEDEAIKQLGSINDIVNQIVSDTSILKITKERFKLDGLRIGEIVLLILGSPVWLSILIALLSCIFAVYVALWSCIVALWSVFAALVVSGPAGIIIGIVCVCGGELGLGGFFVGSGLLSAGFAILMFFGSLLGTKGIIKLTKKMYVGIKKCIKKGRKA